jgi:hypothetical protein
MTAAFFRVLRLSTTSQFSSLIFLFWASACRPAVPPLFPGLQESHAYLILSFGTGEDVITGSVYARSRPEFDVCLHGRTSFYRSLERGLNISYCSPSLDASFQEFINESFQRGKTAYDRLEREDISAIVLSAAQLRDTAGHIRLLYCEPDCSKGLHLLEADEIIVSKPFHTAGERVLPRRFYENDMSVAITDRIWLLYRLPDSRVLAIRIGNSEHAEQLYQFLTVDAERITAEIFQNTAAISVSGSYSAETGGAGNERLILSSQSLPGMQDVIIQGHPYRLLLFPNSSVVLRRDHPSGFRFSSIPEIQFIENGTVVSLPPEQYKPDRAVPGRVALKDPESSTYSPIGICLWSNPCSPEDIPVSIAMQIDAKNLEDRPHCTLDDLTITEINPFGIFLSSDSPIQIGGKFLEFQINRSCSNRSLHFRQTEWTGSFPDSLDRGILVIAANRTYFDTPVTEQTVLRRLKPAPLVIADESREQTITVDDTAVWIYGSADPAGIRRVHSLTSTSGGITYHGNSCSGLRIDLCPAHAMTPGYLEEDLSDAAGIEPPSGMNIPWPGARISEVLPFSGMRFIEFYCPHCKGKSGRLDLFIKRLSDQRVYHYVLPQPETKVITFTPTSTCSAKSNRYGQLYIPASAALYSLGLVDAEGVFHQFDQLQIDTTMYNLMRSENRSLTVTDTGVMLTDRTLPGCEIYATPDTAQFGESP